MPLSCKAWSVFCRKARSVRQRSRTKSLVSSRVVTPIIEELYGTAHEVLSMSVLTTMAIMLVSVLFEKAVLLAVRLLYGRLERL